jgi:transcriptional regulator GlxA family with amidase domain
MILAQLAALMVLLERHFKAASTRNENTVWRTSIGHVKKALEHIAQKYDEPIEINDLARMCNMSLRNFSRRFSEALKRSPHEYIVDTRIAVACSQLLRRDVPVSCVADQTGFRSISAYNRTFREKMGMSPREWRSDKARQDLAEQPRKSARPRAD